MTEGPVLEGTVPWPDDLARQYAKAGWWRGQDLGAEIAAVAAARPDATALVDGATRISYASLLARADALAARLARLGLRPGIGSWSSCRTAGRSSCSPWPACAPGSSR